MQIEWSIQCPLKAREYDNQYLNINRTVCWWELNGLNPISCTTFRDVHNVKIINVFFSLIYCTVHSLLMYILTVTFTRYWSNGSQIRLCTTQEWLADHRTSTGGIYRAIIHRLIAMDKRVLHNAACYSFQEQSGAPPRVSHPNLRVSSWLMCNWLDEWVFHSENPSKNTAWLSVLCASD